MKKKSRTKKVEQNKKKSWNFSSSLNLKSSTVHYLLFIKMLYNNSRLNDGWAIKAFHFNAGYMYIYAPYIYHPYLRNNIVLKRLQRKYFSSSYRRSCSFNIFFSKYNLEVKANKDFEHFSILILNLHQFFCLKKLYIKIKENNFQYECKITINFFSLKMKENYHKMIDFFF